MSLKVVICEEPTLHCFLGKIEHEGLGNFTTLTKSNVDQDNSIVLGKIVRVISTESENQERVILLLKEVLPTCEYGEKFTAVIHCELAQQLKTFNPQVGDRLAFFEPTVLPNPLFYDEKHNNGRKPTKFLLQIGLGRKKALMWCAKKQVGLAKKNTNNTTSDHFGSNVEQSKTSLKSTAQMDPQNKQSTHGKKQTEVSSPKKTDSSKFLDNVQVKKVLDVKKNKQSEDLQANSSSTNSTMARLKPHIHLPDKPQLPSNTQRLNPRYLYKKLADIKENTLSGDLGRVNMFAVVHEFVKSLSLTSAGKYTVICKIIDDSLREDMDFYLHFFITENIILEQIEEGDILRLHRVKMEIFKDDADGRVFNSNDIVLFKKSSPETPIFSAKHTEITDEEKKMVENLKRWYMNRRQPETGEVVLLGDIAREGVYKIVCKLVSKPKLEASCLKAKVTDGSKIKNLVPAFPLDSLEDSPCLATEITVCENERLYVNFKAEDVLFLRDVKASTSKGGLSLKITDHVKPLKVTDNSGPFVREIKRRLKSYKTKNNDDKGEMEAFNEATKNKQNIVQDVRNALNNSASDEGDKSPSKRNSPHKNKPEDEEMESRILSCTKPKVIGDEEKDDRSDLDSFGMKTRKPLFTQNYTDMSDATDEASELVECMTQPVRFEANKDMSLVIVNPASTNLEDLRELIKTVHSPRKVTSQESPKSSNAEDSRTRLASLRNASKNKINETEDVNKSKLTFTPVVKLRKLTEDECKSTSSKQDAQDNFSARIKRLRKRASVLPDENYTQEDLEDADTLVNFSLQNTLKETKEKNKRTRLESESTVKGVTELKDKSGSSEVIIQSEEVQETRNQKVTSWLLDPNNKPIRRIMELDDIDELDPAIVAYILLGKEPEDHDISKYLISPFRRLKVFLVDVIPEPAADPLDLVSGYCHSGCHQLFLFSKIHWVVTDGDYIPQCPECFEMEQDKPLELLLLMELRVMDTNGHITMVLVCREYAEQFLNCSTIDYLKDNTTRISRTQLLSDYIVKNRVRLGHAPLMDITVQQLGKVLCLVNTSLKLPASP